MAAVTAYLVLANPFAGPLPDGWQKRHEKDVAATLAVPDGYQRTVPDRKNDKGHWVTYTDWSGSIWIGLTRTKKSEDTGSTIAGSAAAEMYDDDTQFRQNGSYDLGMPQDPTTHPDDEATHQGKPAAENTIVYTTDDSQHPRPRELRIFYYKATGGDMLKLTVSYPGKGDFTERGREVAKTAIANLAVEERG